MDTRAERGEGKLEATLIKVVQDNKETVSNGNLLFEPNVGHTLGRNGNAPNPGSQQYNTPTYYLPDANQLSPNLLGCIWYYPCVCCRGRFSQTMANQAPHIPEQSVIHEC